MVILHKNQPLKLAKMTKIRNKRAAGTESNNNESPNHKFFAVKNNEKQKKKRNKMLFSIFFINENNFQALLTLTKNYVIIWTTCNSFRFRITQYN